MEMEDENNVVLEENFYQVLHVSKTATAEDINSAYRRLSQMFHPDNYNTARPHKQKWAEHIFNKVKEAYEVLSDCDKRAIYDTLGKNGLEVEGKET